MRRRFRIDRYTVLIAALLPTILLIAWGLTAAHDARLHARQCAVADQWLQDTAAIAPQFENAGTLGMTSSWLTQFRELNSPSHAGILRDAIIGMVSFGQEYAPSRATVTDGSLTPSFPEFATNLQVGAATLTDHCPETRTQLPEAFPMFFTRDS